MPPFDVSLAFLLASIILALAPGPDNIFVLTQSALYGWKQGLSVTIGLCTGLLAHTTLVACGVAALILASPLLFTILKTIGAFYLLYLAWGALRAGKAAPAVPAENTSPSLGSSHGSSLSLPQLYRRGIIMNITNPKVSIFFLAFLPQFTRPGHGPVIGQILWLGLLFILSTILIFGGIAVLAGNLGTKLQQSQRMQRGLNWTAAAIFAGLALHLLLSQAGG
ncbi:MAG: LysE family translocator [Desulfobulbaceae bacterium]|nr:LysE family translocator [Desulfobulbaceae bacterium]